MAKINIINWPEETKEVRCKEDGVIKLITIADAHLSAHNPASYKASYWHLIRSSIEQVKKYAIKENVDAILWAGDIFHLKAHQRNPHWFMADVIELMQGVTNLCIAGNHDLKRSSLEYGLEGQPLDVLLAANVMTLLDQREVVFFDGDGLRVRVSGSSYNRSLATQTRDKKKKEGETLVSLGHFWFGKQSGAFFGEPIWGPDYLLEGEPDIYVIGHHHEDQGIIETAGKMFVCPGSITRTGSHKDDLKRRPGAGYLKIFKDRIESSILRPNLPDVSTLMDLERAKALVKEKDEIKEYVSMLAGTKLDTSNPREMLASLSLGQDVFDKTVYFLEQAEERHGGLESSSIME